MSCSRTDHGAACRDQTQELSIRSPKLYHYATVLPYRTRLFFPSIFICYLISTIKWTIKYKHNVRMQAVGACDYIVFLSKACTCFKLHIKVFKIEIKIDLQKVYKYKESSRRDNCYMYV